MICFTAGNGAQTLLMLGMTTLLMNSPATARFYFPVEEGVCVDRDMVGVAQDRVVHHIDPGVDGRNGAFVPNGVVEVFSNVPSLLHDVLWSIGDFVSDGQAVYIVTAVFLHGVDERTDVFVDLVGIQENLSSPTFEHEPELTRAAELAIVASVYFFASTDGTLRCGGEGLTDPDTDKDRKSVLLGSSGGVVKSCAYCKRGLSELPGRP